jgi:RNAse (barnase) inhibitor barstar
MARPDEITLDMSGIHDEETLHEYLSRILDFPGYFGFNFDAFWDCITTDDQSTMPSHLIVTGLLDLKTHCPEGHSKFMDCLSDYSSEFPDRRLTLHEGDTISPHLATD